MSIISHNQGFPKGVTWGVARLKYRKTGRSPHDFFKSFSVKIEILSFL
jgi:hypothetical protein